MNNYNSINIMMNIGCFIEISKLNNYKEARIKPYQ